MRAYLALLKPCVLVALIVTSYWQANASEPWDPLKYNETDRTGQHKCVATPGEVPCEAKDVVPLKALVDLGFPKAIDSLSYFAGNILLEVIVDKNGYPICVAVIDSELPKPVVEWLLDAMSQQRFNKPITRTGKHVRCYYYFAYYYEYGSEC